MAERTEAQTAAQRLMGDFAPALPALTDDVLFGQVWSRPGLSQRERSLITVAALIDEPPRPTPLPFGARQGQWRDARGGRGDRHPFGVLCGLAKRGDGGRCCAREVFDKA